MTSRFAEVLWGVAIGDAIGNPMEFQSQSMERAFRDSIQAKELRISDDTQMTLFGVEGLLSADPSQPKLVVDKLKDAYLRWFVTQRYPHQYPVCERGLLQFRELYRREAPGNTCMSALESLSLLEMPLNNSKGNGTVMRAAPFAYWGKANRMEWDAIVTVATEDAFLTHKHPLARYSSGVLTALHYSLIEGSSFRGALEDIRTLVPSFLHDRIGYLLADIDNPATFQSMRTMLGGWVAEEALALAIGSVLHSASYLGAVQLAATITGDSDTVGSIAGGLAAAVGREVPAELKERILAKEPIEYVLSQAPGW